MILRRLFTFSKGFYIDIGAHHPYRYSNTYFLYKKGWHGINIDASHQSIKLFKKHRPNDVNINLAVSNTCKEHTFYIFNDSAYNTLSHNLASQTKSKKQAKLIKKIKVTSKPLSLILDEHLKKGQHINLMNIDAEGHDLEVIKSNNWKKYKPDVILIEQQWSTIEDIIKGELYNYITSKGYRLYSKCVNTLIFTSTEYKHTK